VESNLDAAPEDSKLIREKKHLKGTLDRLRTFIDNVDGTWIFEETNKAFTFRPTWIPESLSEQFFFSHAQKFVLMSATFSPAHILGKLLGRPPGDFDYFQIPSTFPVENRQVWMNPVANLTHKTFDEEAEKVIGGIMDVLSKHLFEKGIVHAVFYKLTNLIMSRGLDRFITHNSHNREDVLENFKASDRPLVLVSPSIERGVDLPDDLCGFIVWAKAPFLSLGDKLTSRRVYGSSIGSLWYRSLCAQTIVQGAAGE